MALDPICGMTVDEATGLPATRDGQTYYFCSEHCRRTFLGLPPEAPRAHTSAYFCPMCEGVESDTPGTCPKCGMALESATPGGEDTSELDDMTHRFRVGLVFGVPVLLLSMGPMIIPTLHHWLPPAISHWIQLILATPVVGWCGWPFFKRAGESFRSWNLNMFTLIGIGTGTAFAASLLALFMPGLFPDSFRHHGELPVYFEAATTIIILVLLGQVLELRARRRTGDALRELLKLAPTTAYLVRDSGEDEVPLEAVHPGDILRVKPGGKIPVDGDILEGNGSIDMSMLTGESAPVDALPGTPVAAGTINLSGSFLMKARKIGSDTLFARIVHMVTDAQRSRAPVQKLADRVASIFVPAVGAIALATFCIWAAFGTEPRLAYALMNAVSVLIVACPCALGLATPMAVMVGVGRGAKAGVLIRDAGVLETLRNVDTILVDKTGTLTEGTPDVSAIKAMTSGGGTGDTAGLLHLAASVEVHSEHPLGKAIVRHARQLGLALSPVDNIVSLTGAGVQGTIEGRTVFVGRQADVPGIAVMIDGKLAGCLTLSDRVRQSAGPALQQLRAMGLKVIMLTGDNSQEARTVAEALGIQDVHANMTPAGKLEVIRSLKANGHRVAMTGDGINDSPALALADVGIAMGTGTDVAMETAGVVLVKGDLQGMVRAVHLSRGVMRNIRQNLFWAFAYNIAGVTIATGLLYPLYGILMSPMLAALAMSFSSVSVVANALRLKRLSL